MPNAIEKPVPAPITEDTSVRPGPLALKAALDEKRDFLIAMPDEQVETGLKLDASTAAGVVVGALPGIVPHRDAIAARFGAEGIALVDDLRTVAYACQQADIEVDVADDGAVLATMSEEIAAHHKLLVTELDSLANRKLIDRSRIDPGRPILGYRTLVKSTLILIALFRAVWPQIEGKTFLTSAELDRLEQSAQSMLEALHQREHGSRQRMPAVELRTRALSHLVSSYDEVRRMITYVRWRHDDADDIAPSLYATRRGRTRTGPTVPSEPVVTPPPAGPTTPIDPVPGSGGSPFTS